MVWTWDECISHLNCFPDLQQWYYRDVIQVRAPRDLDEIILRTIAMAFARPAFEVPLDCESPGDFLQALKDTQRAIRTGELVDRESRLVIRKSIGSYHELDDRVAWAAVRQIGLRLRQLRTQLDQGFKGGTIKEVNGYLEIGDVALARYLEDIRGGCVGAMEEVLRHAGLPGI
jgi:hypothetical protein